MRVLIADDDPQSRRMLQFVLERLGHQVISEANGRAAYEKIVSDEPPEMAILDWMMPQLDGVDVCRMVRERKDARYVYLVLVTAKTGPLDVVKGLDAGADDYIEKPFNVSVLQARIRAGERVLALQRGLLLSKEALREQVSHDALTGALNRGALAPTLERDLLRAGREKKALSVVMIDLDEFKAVNDHYGHQAGDLVLTEAAKRLRSALRGSDALVRYGGEEFLAVLPDCGPEDALLVAERMRRTVSGTPIPLPDRELRVTCSAGVMSVEASQTMSAEELVHAADQALLEAKRRGRNRVISACPSPVALRAVSPPPLPQVRRRVASS